MEKRRNGPLNILLAGPRGFCAGVDRAVMIVEQALRKYGPPVYVRHEIVHNRHVVESLEARGAVFVDHLSECPDDRPVIFSAHGVPKSVPAAAAAREMIYIDATCPLVSKVHREAERHHAEGCHIILIGHAGHPEVIGTMGQLPAGAMTLWKRRRTPGRFSRPGPAGRWPMSRRPPWRWTKPRKFWPFCRNAFRKSAPPGGRISATPPPTARKR